MGSFTSRSEKPYFFNRDIWVRLGATTLHARGA